MKKGLFNKQYGLRSAVIDGRKTVTRRICKNQTNPSIEEAKWKIGEVIAIAQSYEDMANEGGDVLANMLQDETNFKKEYCGAGWHNAMFTKPSLMPHRIKITNVSVERLQDISEEDCLKEGISVRAWNEYVVNGMYLSRAKHMLMVFVTAKAAFAALIKRISGKRIWESNPFVFVYEFELIK